ncbi:MAG: DUF92 domain-containing protein [bacterium]|nr:DUF92 domain-containing protein [bacterium]
MLDRQLNILFFFATVFVFLLFSEGFEQTRFFVAVFLSILFVTIAFVLNWLTIDGALSALLFGIISLGFGGLSAATVVLVFFVTSSLLSKSDKNDDLFTIPFRRDGYQVWSNGFWFALWLIFWFTTDALVFEVAAVSSIAFSTADTWSSEIGGKRVKGTTWMIGSFKKVEPGLDGGVSVAGTASSLVGALLIALIYWAFNSELTVGIIVLVILAGIAGSLIDSLLGNYVQGSKIPRKISALFNYQITKFDNNTTNWVSAGSASLLAICIFLLVF